MIYADHNATSPLDPIAWAEMRPFFEGRFHNPSSPYTAARAAALAISDARRRVAALLDAEEEEVRFTSGGTESNSWALHIARAWNPERRHWICSAVEHASILEPLAALEQEGHRVTLLPVDRNGQLDMETLAHALTPDTALVSVMSANNETGILHPVAEIARMARSRGVPTHTDATQSVGRMPISFRALGVDLMTCCAHKMHGPKGVGALVARVGIDCAPLFRGGGQEGGQRAGTENVPAIVGFGRAAEQAYISSSERLSVLRAIVEDGVRARIPQAILVGAEADRIPNSSLFLIPGLDTDVVLAALDMAGVCASSGSACASGSSEPSHVLRAMGWLDGEKRAAVRISWGRFSTEQDANDLVNILSRIVLEIQVHERPPR